MPLSLIYDSNKRHDNFFIGGVHYDYKYRKEVHLSAPDAHK